VNDLTGKIALIDRYGAFLGVKEGRFQLKVGGKVVWELAPVELDSIVFLVDGASVSAAAIYLAVTFGIDIVFMIGHRPTARVVQAPYGSTLRNWLFQLNTYRSKSKRAVLAKLFVEGKVHNQRVVLMEFYRLFRASGKRGWRSLLRAIDDIEKIQNKLSKIDSVDGARQVEAEVAKIYWSAVAKIIPEELGFERRITRARRIPGEGVDSFNIALNIGYSALLKEVWRTIFIVGLNPYIGFLHKPRAGKMALAFDLMEEFRPICVDRPLIKLARRNSSIFNKLKENDREAVREVWRAVMSRIHEGKKPISPVILEQARKLVRHFRGTDTYKPYKSRW